MIPSMLISHHREKLISAIVFFAERTRNCGKLKLIKLLYLLDFGHFRTTGRSVTGLEYSAWKMGPVPVSFFEEWDDMAPDMAAAIEVRPKPVIDYVRETVHPRVAFDPTHFTRRELDLMGELATRFRDDLSRPMINVTHEESGPWSAIWDDGRGRNERIPFNLAVPTDDPHRNDVLESAKLYAGLMAAQATPN
jgi:uncharacterized phage-associated protein